jgi:predicted transcriptional regulator
MRSASLKVNITPEIYAKLKELADRHGQPAAVLASVAIGQYVSAHCAQFDAAQAFHDQALALIERLAPQQLLDLDRGGRS